MTTINNNYLLVHSNWQDIFETFEVGMSLTPWWTLFYEANSTFIVYRGIFRFIAENWNSKQKTEGRKNINFLVRGFLQQFALFLVSCRDDVTRGKLM